MKLKQTFLKLILFIYIKYGANNKAKIENIETKIETKMEKKHRKNELSQKF